ncbi:MAG: sulfatase-like hydrolase/transferase, partial [Planctomycetota bacterium]
MTSKSWRIPLRIFLGFPQRLPHLSIHMMLRLLFISLSVITFAALTKNQASAEDKRPNVLMICVDDLNDWVEPLGGHPQARTPAMARLAQSGVLFSNAHCQSPLCNSSRTSLMLSRRPSQTGVYGLAPWFRGVPELSSLTTLPQHFAAAGYQTITAGKVFHGGAFRKRDPLGRKEFDVIGPPGSPGIKPPKKLIPPTPGGDHPLMDWGVFDHDEKDKGDYRVASFLVEQLENLDGKEPVFIAGGFFLPHVPCHVTPKYWDMFPEQTLILPHIDRLE